ncbi:hypothetical protein PPTG_24503 [Phytophthora nicotianae INRA-310]|uniref:Uncharacterized protein n=1 Tax=Phytophthora nicotianae (strain INRA-310) TaxID=761204 RepID=W2PDC0_PHYN3|nr:hypothetical protein PPTG_24503 [Phytophthora nicotianae INRA-310]ETM99047.1 hypothetical protein PPTG_24503 [Phytophthora nicotianae INRA-310]
MNLLKVIPPNSTLFRAWRRHKWSSSRLPGLLKWLSDGESAKKTVATSRSGLVALKLRDDWHLKSKILKLLDGSASAMPKKV